MGERIAVLFDLIVKLHQQQQLPSMDKMDGPWIERVDSRWTFALNGKDKAVRVEPEGSMGWDVQPYHVAVWFNGWAAGEFSPFSGWMAAGDGANEETFIAALRDRLAQSSG